MSGLVLWYFFVFIGLIGCVPFYLIRHTFIYFFSFFSHIHVFKTLLDVAHIAAFGENKFSSVAELCEGSPSLECPLSGPTVAIGTMHEEACQATSGS